MKLLKLKQNTVLKVKVWMKQKLALVISQRIMPRCRLSWECFGLEERNYLLSSPPHTASVSPQNPQNNHYTKKTYMVGVFWSPSVVFWDGAFWVPSLSLSKIVLLDDMIFSPLWQGWQRMWTHQHVYDGTALLIKRESPKPNAPSICVSWTVLQHC